MKAILFCLALLGAVVGRAQIVLDWYTASVPPAPANPLLDDYPGAAAAYSLRLLRTGYTGNCIEVRRSNDNALQNIGFAGGVVDTAALKTFCGTNSCFVRTWYNQSLNTRDATQATAARQPRIVNAGVIYRINGRVAIEFNDANQWFLSISPTPLLFSFTGNATNLFVARNRNTAASQYGSVFSQFSGANLSVGVQMQQFPNTATAIATDVYGPGGVTTGALIANTQYLFGVQWQNWSTHKSNGNTIIKINSASQALTAYGANPATFTSATQISIGRFDATTNAANYFLGDIQEIVIYTSALSTGDFSGAETNINSFYNIY